MISIVIPVYNIEKYIVRCLRSVQEQSCADFECIIINDGSTDSSRQLCEPFLQDKRFKIYDQINSGVAEAVQAGIRAASGKHIMFLDGDDFLADDAVDRVQSVLKKADYDLVLYDYFKYYDEKSKILTKMPFQEGEIEDSRLLDLVSSNGVPPARWNKVFNKDILCKTSKYIDTRVSIGDDINMVIPAIYFAKTAYYIDSPLIYYCQNDNSFTHVYKEGYFDSCKFLYEALTLFFENERQCDIIPQRIFFNNVKTLIQRIAIMYNGNKRKEMQRILQDTEVVNLLKQYLPQGTLNKIFAFLMKHKMVVALKIAAAVNIKLLKRWR